jgi:hypothetical protein
VQTQPVTAVVKPPTHNLVLVVVEVWPSYISDKQLSPRQPSMNVCEIVSRSGKQALLFEQFQQPEPRVVHIVST